MKQADRRESCSSKPTDSQEPCARWQQCSAGVSSLPADIPFVFRHWIADDASPWHQYTLHYRTDYTYRRLGVQCGGGMHTSDSRPARLTLRDSNARYSADNVAGAQTSTTQCERTVKSLGRTGHRSAPASLVDNSQQRARLVHDDDIVNITTVSLQLPPRQSVAADHQLPTDKCFLRCPAIRIHLNTSSSSSFTGPQSVVTLQAPMSLPTTTTTSNLLPRVITECSSCHSTQQQHRQTVSSTVTMSDSYSTFSGRTMRPVPSNGFSIDDRTM